MQRLGSQDQPGFHPEAVPPQPAESPVEVALLDRNGVIVSVNAAWDAFCEANGGDPSLMGVGASYLDVCSAAGDDPVAKEVAAAINAALRGDLPAPMTLEVPCHSPDTSRWFDTLISSRLDDDGSCLGATVTLSLAQSGPFVNPAPDDRLSQSGESAEGAIPESGLSVPAYYVDRSERLGDGFAQALLELAPIGIIIVDDEGLIVRASRQAEETFGYSHDSLIGASVECLFPNQLIPMKRELRSAAADQTMNIATVGTFAPCLHADGSEQTVRLSLSSVALSRGAGAMILTTEALGYRPDDASGGDLHNEFGRIAEDLDQVIRLLHGCGLTITTALKDHQLEEDLVAGLSHVIAQLDVAINEIRMTVFGRLRDQTQTGDVDPG